MDASAATTSAEPRPSSELCLNGASEDPNRGGPGQNSTARYKLIAPAKLPISRSPCITIPPGLSPTSFLESPVLLSNMKVESSPTTGSLRKLQQTVHGSKASATFAVTTACFNTNTVEDRKSSFFEFKPLNRLNMVPADFNNHVIKQSTQAEGLGKAQSFVSSPLVESEIAVPANELSLSSPVQMVSSSPSAPVDVDLDDVNHKSNTATGLQESHVEVRGNGISVAAEKTSDDGYNWRKYGQKLVKGSEFPRSYYKCTHPNCEVKKLFERSHDGQIAEIIYKGTHDHPKPQPSCRYSTGTIMSIQVERSDKDSSLAGLDDKASSMYGQLSHAAELNSASEPSTIATNDDGLEGVGFVSNRISDDNDDDDPFSKRRKMELGNVDITPVVKPIREPRVVVQTLSEVDILDDGYRWRKYGQKVVRGNPNPRSYYKCTNAGCPVRKHVERASHDPKAVITTYEGKHNHDVPAAKNSSHDMAVAAAGQTRIKLEESDTISLDLGMGISSAAEHRSNAQGKIMHSEFGNTQTHTSNSNFKFVHTSSAPVYFGVLNNSSNPYGSRDNRSDGSALNHASYPCPQSMGRILMGP
ncbi:probable WRKY transcription factor 20 isoform X1 [Vigna radiata var. radiata]|uniref:Probable WRKY transcription factor 20 isoform X1 n=1 Tax=Vigna radiata var. radiata TaxID=3916 RepID=A0A1S3UG24_VIGRR|nr:probable WRKY transcription factor 20 isoform X1 [Vigna radiata var. radiata]